MSASLEIKRPQQEIGTLNKPTVSKLNPLGDMKIPKADLGDKKERHAFLKRKVTYNTGEIIKVYNQNYERIVSCVLSMHGLLAKCEKLDKFDNNVIPYLDKLFEVSIAAIDTEIQGLKDSEFDLSSLNDFVLPTKTSVEVPVHNPSLGQFLTLSLKTDELLSLASYLYASGQISSSLQKDYYYKYPFFVKQTCGRVQSVTATVRRLANKETDELERELNNLKSGVVKYSKNITKVKSK